jgi:hypothetical protein
MMTACLAILAGQSLPWFVTTETDASWQYETRVDEGQPKAVLVWRNTADFDATWSLTSGVNPQLVQQQRRQFNQFTASVTSSTEPKVWPNQLYNQDGTALAYYWFAPIDSFLSVRVAGSTVLSGVAVTGTGSISFAGLEPGQYEFVLFDDAATEAATVLSTSPQWTMHEVIKDGPNTVNSSP